MHINWSGISSFLLVIGWLIPFILLFVVPTNRKPSSATAWLLLTFMLPYLGILLFLLIGSPKLSKRRRDMQHEMNNRISRLVTKLEMEPEFKEAMHPVIASIYKPFVDLNNNLGELPPLGGNSVMLLHEYPEVFKHIARDINHAKKFVHIEFFAFSRDEETEPIFLAMEKAKRRGVEVKALIDHLGSRKYPNFSITRKSLSDAGIENHLSLPLKFFWSKDYTRPDLRNHRKIIVIDGEIGYTGSQNLIKRNYFAKSSLYYDELVARVRGPVVGELEAAFATDWYSETGILLDKESFPQTAVSAVIAGNTICQILPSGPGFDNENNLKLFTSLIYAARKNICIVNPYLVPDDSLMTAITSAVQRGVDVKIINSEIEDQFLVGHAQHSYYEEFLQCGVKIYLYQSPILLHTKTMSIDDDIAVIGSSNLDIRSFQLNLEITLICYDPKVVRNLHKIESMYLSRSKPIHTIIWNERPIKEKLFENISRLTSSLQ